MITGAVTLLGVTNQIQIDKDYLTALFGSLLLELVAAVVTLFRSAKFFVSEDRNSKAAAIDNSPAYLPSSRVAAIDGMWKGTAQQAVGPGGKPVDAEVTCTYEAQSPVIKGRASFLFTEGPEKGVKLCTLHSVAERPVGR